MATYKFNCRKCTNKVVDAVGDEWCRAIIEGRRACYIESGDKGSNFVFNCNEYSDDPYRTTMKIGGLK